MPTSTARVPERGLRRALFFAVAVPLVTASDIAAWYQGLWRTLVWCTRRVRVR